MFRKKQFKNYAPPKREQMLFKQLLTASDEELTKIGNEILKGIPVIVNFAQLDVDAANKAIAFLSGVVYGISGVLFPLDSQKGILFADASVYDDGSVNTLLSEIQGDK